MNLKENVKSYDVLRKEIEEKKELISKRKKEFESEIEGIVSEIKSAEEKLGETFSLIETEIKDEFEKNKKIKKFYGGFGVQERKNIVYDEKRAFEFAKEKDMFLMLDKKSFEKAVEGLNLDFVEVKNEVKVTVPKEIVIED